ncbi:MAG TPA: beta-N-acetylhexosaminidase [Polyangiaceae bacterium]|nr:beta-N-acetylhexosaminidase [Polyangiaceae bacterium]
MTDLVRAAARLLNVGFPGTTLDAETARLLELGVGGVVLFARNVEAPSQVAELTAALKRGASAPLVVAVDQEGGSVARLRAGFTRLPPFRALGDAGDPELARAVGALVGTELRAVGVDWNFAPVLDVDTNPENPVIGTRALGADPERVASIALAFAAGMLSAGVAPCGKHFPGHGDTRQDSHHELPRLPHPLARLERVELVPFTRAIAAGMPALMAAHVVFEALDRENPASMSARVVGELLRARLGFSGLVVTDDLEMKAIADHFAIEDVAVRALTAGVDVLLVCHSPELARRAIDAIVRAVKSGAVGEEILQRAVERVASFSERFARPPLAHADLSLVGSSAHAALVDRLREAAGVST